LLVRKLLRARMLARRPLAQFALMPWLRPCYGLPDFGAAIGAFIDKVDFRHAPVRLDVPHIHRQQSDAAGAKYRRGIDFALLDVGWHVGSPSKNGSTVDFNPDPT
jgi:hypothetical protein